MTLKIFVIFLLACLPCFPQGFDWQYDSRLPFEVPDIFYSAGTAYKLNIHKGNLPILENDLPCCNFTEGSGSRFDFAAGAEYWTVPRTTISARLAYSSSSGIFTALKTEPRRIDPDLPPVDWVTELEAVVSVSLIGLEIGGKYLPVEDSHLFVSAAILCDLLLSQNGKYAHRVVSPDYLPFENGSFERTPAGVIPELSSVIIEPRLGVGYDLDLGLGMYLSPSLVFSYNLNSRAIDYSWHTYSVGLAVQVSRGFR